MSPPNFNIFLSFFNFPLNSYDIPQLMRQLVYKDFYTRNQVSFYLRQTNLLRKQGAQIAKKQKTKQIARIDPGHNIWQKVKKSSKIEQGRKIVISSLVKVLTASAKK